MAHKKGQGSVKNGRDSVSKRLGVKKFGSETVVRRQHHHPPARDEVLARQECWPRPRLYDFCAGRRAGAIRSRRSPGERRSGGRRDRQLSPARRQAETNRGTGIRTCFRVVPSFDFRYKRTHFAMKYTTYLLFGAPGSGKGTQGRSLGSIPRFFHCACGDVFRSIDTRTRLGRAFLEYSSRGELVPDDITVELWKARIDAAVDAHQFKPDIDVLILDGIPRNVGQAEIMEN